MPFPRTIQPTVSDYIPRALPSAISPTLTEEGVVNPSDNYAGYAVEIPKDATEVAIIGLITDDGGATGIEHQIFGATRRKQELLNVAGISSDIVRFSNLELVSGTVKYVHTIQLASVKWAYLGVQYATGAGTITSQEVEIQFR